MATWKKIIVSGSDAHLAAITSSVLTDNNLVIAGVGGALESSGLTLVGSTLSIGANSIVSTGVSTKLTGSFTGSFTGDGSGLTGLATVLSITADSGGPSSVDLLTQTLDIEGTANEVVTSVSGQTITIGLPDNVTIGNNLTVTGNLSVLGDYTYVNTANLYVEDKFILLNSGSANPDEGGIIIDEGNGQGHAFVYDSNASRFAYTGSLPSNATSVTPDAFAPAVIDLNEAAHTDKAEYQKNGNIKVDTSGDIWIYS